MTAVLIADNKGLIIGFVKLPLALGIDAKMERDRKRYNFQSYIRYNSKFHFSR
jgi:hypothetical protein